MITPHPRLSMNQATLRTATLVETIDAVTTAGIQSLGVWREPVADLGLRESVSRIQDSGLRISSMCRGGFFTTADADARQLSLDDNRRAIDETAALAAAGAPGSSPVLVLVVGGIPEGSRDLVSARARVLDALAALEPHAAQAGVTLAIEPLHPMYVSDRAVVSTLAQAIDLAENFDAATVGVVVDTFHVWWDPDVERQIARAGTQGRIASYQVCDWATPLPEDVLLGRHYPGDGVIDFARLTRAVMAAGYTGDIEVEIFNQNVWNDTSEAVVQRTIESFDVAVGRYADHGVATERIR